MKNTGGKSFTQSNPTKMNLSPKFSMISVQNEINSEVSGSDYKKMLVWIADKDHLLRSAWLTFKGRLPQP